MWRFSLAGVQKVDPRAQKDDARGRKTVAPVTPGHKKVPRGGRFDSQCSRIVTYTICRSRFRSIRSHYSIRIITTILLETSVKI
jgi:hypothetical protein